MPVEFLTDPAAIDVESVLCDRERIKNYLQHRHEMLQVDAILDYDRAKNTLVGLKRVRDNEFWVRGHIPGNPVMPGVLIIETAAQVATVQVKMEREAEGDDVTERFFGFGGVKSAKFRKPVVPGDDLIILTRIVRYRTRSFVVMAQGIVDGKAVFEGEIIGMMF